MAQTHETLVQAVQKSWSLFGRGRLFKNHNGKAYIGKIIGQAADNVTLIKNLKRIKYGLTRGSSDLVGIEFVNLSEYLKRIGEVRASKKTQTVMQKVPIFCSVEIKTNFYPKIEDHQKDWMRFVQSVGGIAYVAREDSRVLGDGYTLEEWIDDDEKEVKLQLPLLKKRK